MITTTKQITKPMRRSSIGTTRKGQERTRRRIRQPYKEQEEEEEERNHNNHGNEDKTNNIKHTKPRIIIIIKAIKTMMTQTLNIRTQYATITTRKTWNQWKEEYERMIMDDPKINRDKKQ